MTSARLQPRAPSKIGEETADMPNSNRAIGSTAMVGVRAELAAAVRAVNAAYARLPQERRPDPAGYDALDGEVDAAFAAGDRERALVVIRAWRDRWLSRFRATGAAR